MRKIWRRSGPDDAVTREAEGRAGATGMAHRRFGIGRRGGLSEVRGVVAVGPPRLPGT
jgi:hypothetical protein